MHTWAVNLKKKLAYVRHGLMPCNIHACMDFWKKKTCVHGPWYMHASHAIPKIWEHQLKKKKLSTYIALHAYASNSSRAPLPSGHGRQLANMMSPRDTSHWQHGKQPRLSPTMVCHCDRLHAEVLSLQATDQDQVRTLWSIIESNFCASSHCSSSLLRVVAGTANATVSTGREMRGEGSIWLAAKAPT